MEEGHYSIYCINFIHDRIDVLDSSPEDHKVYHQVLGDRIIHRLNLLFQLATNSTIKQFTRFKRPIIDVCSQTRAIDCGFFALKFMELWNGESFHVPILTVRLTIFTKYPWVYFSSNILSPDFVFHEFKRRQTDVCIGLSSYSTASTIH